MAIGSGYLGFNSQFLRACLPQFLFPDQRLCRARGRSRQQRGGGQFGERPKPGHSGCGHLDQGHACFQIRRSLSVVSGRIERPQHSEWNIRIEGGFPNSLQARAGDSLAGRILEALRRHQPHFACLLNAATIGAANGYGCLPPSRPGEFHPEPLTDPDLNLSIHPARAIGEGLPPFVKTAGSSCHQLTL